MKKIIARGTALFLTLFMTLTFFLSICYATETETKNSGFVDQSYTSSVEIQESKDIPDQTVENENDYHYGLAIVMLIAVLFCAFVLVVFFTNS